MKGYVFISNSTKPNEEKANSRDMISLSNVNKPCVNAALNMGYEVFLGVNRNRPEELSCELPIKLFDSHTYRSITAFNDNRIAFNNLNKILKENDIEVIHCNTPVGGLIGRLCGRKNHIKYVIYTAHGFHFYKGAPLINRTVFKWAERIMAHWTDIIITMNQEDYEAAKTFKLKKGGKVYKVHGVGISLSEYQNIKKDDLNKRNEFSLSQNDFICISAGDLVLRKNYRTAIESIAYAKNPHIHYLICGEGPEKDNLRSLAKKLGIDNQIHFLGYRTDIKELLAMSDCFLFTSTQEGLPRSLLEAMAVGLPVVVSKIRGNVDLIENGKGGFLCTPFNAVDFANSINILTNDKTLCESMANYNLEVIKQYDISVVEEEIKKIYKDNI
jgi:glycosyltransferase involved in cell wall biosynthesis